MKNTPRPSPVVRAGAHVGESFATWRKLQRLTASQLADRAGTSRSTLSRLEGGDPSVSFETVLRVARALGILDDLVDAIDPYQSDVGRLRADEILPTRVR
jgi:transcriptional regulator with XRE-family HTH domain